MGYGDNEPPAIRADRIVPNLYHPGGFQMLFLTFVNWDVIQLSWTTGSGAHDSTEIDSGRASTDYLFTPTISGESYHFVARGCAKTVGGGTGHCSPDESHDVIASENTNSVGQFLERSGIVPSPPLSLHTLLGIREPPISLRQVMWLDN